MNLEDRRKIYAALGAPFPEEAIERTRSADTKRPYDTTGIRYQFIVNRLNEVLDVGGWRDEATIKVREVKTAKDRVMFEALCELVLELGSYESGTWIPIARAHGIGGHTATSEVDARKGAHTSAFKKAAAFFGAGRQAYEGTLDDEPEPEQQPQQQQRSAADPTEITHWRARLAGCEDKAAIDALWRELLKAHPRENNPFGLGADFSKRAREVQRRAG